MNVYLYKNTELKYLSMENCGLSESSFQKFFEKDLKFLKKLTNLNISNNRTDDNGIKALGDYLIESSILFLGLNDCFITLFGFRYILMSIQTN